ncbi:MAG TPA: DUF3352 domain-containing protein [Solirubrobacterales bacterium]|nr:DUF3352 domain-containing protein [Solirubrobacterales bacterium]
MKRRLARVSLLAALATAILVAGCGGDDEGADTGAASIVPASAPVYLDALIKPGGAAKEDADAALGTILKTEDPGTAIVQEVEKQAAADGADFDYARDVEPWLGESFTVFLTTIGGDTSDSEGAFAFETSDPDKALEFFKGAEDATGETKEYEGVEYEFDEDGDVLGRIDDFIVGGDENAFKAAVDAHNGDSLAEKDDFKDGIDELSDDRLATLYVPPQEFLDAVPEKELSSDQRDLLEKSLGDAAREPVLGEVTASATDVSMELSAGGGDVETPPSTLLPELPSAAWLGVGLADIGAAVQRSVENVGEAGAASGVDAETIRRQLRSQLGINLERDVINTLGDSALFVEGTTVKDVSGALVIQSKDPSGSAELINKLQDLISSRASPQDARVQPLASAGGDQGFQIVDPSGELQQPIQVVQHDDKIVVGYGRRGVEQALSGGDTLANDPAFSAAQDAIGDLGVDAFLSFAPVFQLAEGAGAGADPDFKQAKPYLDSLNFLATGSGSDGDRATLRVIVGLR